jgi:hypothetical protein
MPAGFCLNDEPAVKRQAASGDDVVALNFSSAPADLKASATSPASADPPDKIGTSSGQRYIFGLCRSRRRADAFPPAANLDPRPSASSGQALREGDSEECRARLAASERNEKDPSSRENRDSG